MKLSFLPDIIKPRTHIIALLCVELFLVFRLCVPFWSNNLQSWDLMGHYYSAWFVHEHLFPNITGWNPTFFMGYEQGQFYPPLFSYLTALLGQVLSVKAAFKILVIAGILATPVSFYVLGRKWDFRPWNAIFIMVAMLALLFIVPYETGINFYSTLNVGNINHGMSVPLLCFYLACLPESIHQKRYLLASILMAAIVLMHPFMSIAAAFFFMAFVVAGVRDRTTFCYCVLHVSLTFFLCAFWILPFALSDRVELSPMILFKLSAFEISVITFLLTTYLICRQPHRVFTKPLMKTHIAFWGVVLLIGTLQVISSLFFYDLRLRYHRFYMLYFLFMPILGCSVLELLSSPLKKRLYAVFTILAIALALYFDKTTPKGIDDVFVPQLEKLDGRVFVHTKPTEYARHVVQHRLPMESGNIAIKGLFAESSGNAEYLFNVERIMLGAHARRRDVPWWGFEWPRWLVSYEMRSHLSDYFRLFQVNYIFTNRVLSIPDVSIVDRKNLGEGFWLYKVGEHDLFEVLDEMPEIIPKERAAMRTWLFGEGPENICHEIRPGIEEDPKQGHISYEGADVKILAKNDLLSEFRIEVNSDKPVPILMKQTYSERWKVTSDGVELKTYRASPYLTLFYGKGVIDIRFAKSRINEVGNFLSVLGVLWGFWLLWVRFRRRAAS